MITRPYGFSQELGPLATGAAPGSVEWFDVSGRFGDRHNGTLHGKLGDFARVAPRGALPAALGELGGHALRRGRSRGTSLTRAQTAAVLGRAREELLLEFVDLVCEKLVCAKYQFQKQGLTDLGWRVLRWRSWSR